MMRTPSPFAVGLIVALSAGTASAQDMRLERDRARTMLTEIRKDIERNYYDPTFRGLDLTARFKAAADKLESADSLGQIFAVVAQPVLDLNDSHTRFFPPQRSRRYDYGFQMRIVGDDCYVLAVRPSSDAETQGLRPGDKLLAIAGYAVTRDSLWKLKYLLYSVRPLAGVRISVQSPGGPPRQIDVRTRMSADRRIVDVSDPESIDFWEVVRSAEREARENAHQYLELGDDVLVWKMPAFDLGDDGLEKLVAKASRKKAFVIDMRGNTGGRVAMLERLIGRTFTSEVTLGEVRERKGAQPWIVRPKGKPLSGPIVALVDSDSASASEIFARALQIEKRGTVLGDRTAGAVMQSRYRRYQIGADQVLYYNANISIAAIVMRDGLPLEGRGVVPDETALPTAQDLATGRDPVLARALQLAGATVTPERAGKMFPVTWSQ